MVVKRITKLSNPRRRATARKRNLSPKQIKFFGTKAQRAALKRKRSMAKANPKRRHVTHRRRTPAKNPAHLLTFAAGVNPQTKKKRRVTTNMPATKKRRVVHHRNSAKKNTRKMNVHHRRRNVIKAHNPRHHRRNTRVIVKNAPRLHHYHHSSNPSLFGQSNAFEMAKMVVGGLAGVTITKAVPNMLPSMLTSSPIARVATSIATAFLSGYLAGKFADRTLGDAIMFGGMMQAGSVALNSFLPSVGATIGLQGLGGGLADLIAGSYPIPQNPLFPQYNPGYGLPAAAVAALPPGHPAKVAAAAAAAPATTGVAGIFGPAF